jgi:hypothetical protein
MSGPTPIYSGGSSSHIRLGNPSPIQENTEPLHHHHGTSGTIPYTNLEKRPQGPKEGDHKAEPNQGWNQADYFWDDKGLYYKIYSMTGGKISAQEMTDRFYFVNGQYVLRDYSNPSHAQDQDNSFLE